MNKPSTQNLEALPEINVLRKNCRILSRLSAIQHDCRFTMQKHSKGHEIAQWSNGEGNELYIYFTDAGAIMKGFDHESSTASEEGEAYPGVLDDFPEEFKNIYEQEFEEEDLSFCIWQIKGSGKWITGNIDFPKEDSAGNRVTDPDGSENILSEIIFNPETYNEFCKWYYERECEMKALKDIFDEKPITEEMAKKINPAVRFKMIKNVLERLKNL